MTLLLRLLPLLPWLAVAALGAAGVWVWNDRADLKQALSEQRVQIERQAVRHTLEIENLRADVQAADAWRQSFERLDYSIGTVQSAPLSPAVSAYHQFIIQEQAK